MLEANEIAEAALSIWRQYLRTYSHTKFYPNVTRERATLRYTAESLVKEYDEAIASYRKPTTQSKGGES